MGEASRNVTRPYLPTNYKLVINWLNCNLKKVKHKGDLLSKYDQIIKDQLDKGFIERANQIEVEENTHYIPHLAVLKIIRPHLCL